MNERREKLEQFVAVAKQRVSHKLGELRWWFLIRGIAAIGLAVAAFFWPGRTMGLLVNLLGIYLLLDGLVGALGAIRSGGRGGFPVFAIVSVIIGAVLFFWPEFSTRLVLKLLGGWALLQGIGMFLSNRNTEDEARRMFSTLGAILVLIGLVLMIWPGTGVAAIAWIIAAVALIIGCILIYISIRLRRISIRLESTAAE